MKATMRFSLKAGERIFINGAVLTVSQKVTLSLLNDACFLLEAHVLQIKDATTPMRQLYFVVQAMMMQPGSREGTLTAFRDLHPSLLATYTSEEVCAALNTIRDLVEGERFFEALKSIRGLFAIDDELRASKTGSGAQQAA